MWAVWLTANTAQQHRHVYEAAPRSPDERESESRVSAQVTLRGDATVSYQQTSILLPLNDSKKQTYFHNNVLVEEPGHPSLTASPPRAVDHPTARWHIKSPNRLIHFSKCSKHSLTFSARIINKKQERTTRSTTGGQCRWHRGSAPVVFLPALSAPLSVWSAADTERTFPAVKRNKHTGWLEEWEAR